MVSRSRFDSLRNAITILAAFACLALAPAAGRAAVAQWTGGSSGTWGTASSWSGGVVPNNTQSVTYLATVAQAVGFYSTVVINDTTPVVQVDQLTIRNTASVIVGAGSRLRLNDIGSGTSLQRSLVGGGILQVNGILNVYVPGGVISGGNSILMVGGRITGNGRIENSRTITGYGTIGNSANLFDSNLGIYNIGAVGANPALVRISAESAGQTLTLGAGISTAGIRNNYAMLSANFGGILDVVDAGAELDNTNGLIQATGSSSEVRLGGYIINDSGTINGAGTIRVPSGDFASIASSTTGTIGGTNFVAEGDLTLQNQLCTGDLQVWNSLNAKGVATTGHLLLKADAGTPVVNSTTLFTNSGQIEGAGSFTSVGITNGGSIDATYAGKTLTLLSPGISLTGSGALGSKMTGATLVIGNPGATSAVTGSAGTSLVAVSGATIDINANVSMPDTTSTVNGTLKLHGTSTMGTISGSGDLIQSGTLTATKIRTRSLSAGGQIVLNGTGSSRLTTLTIPTGGSVDLRAPMIIDSTTGTALADMRTFAAAGKLKSSAGRLIGMALGSSIGSGTFLWNGEPVTPTSILLLPTIAGDANLDRSVGFDDLVRLAQNYNGSSKTWSDGDFNYDGGVNFPDLVLLAQHYGASASELGTLIAGVGDADFASDGALAQSLVPEPATLLLGAVGTPLLARRRR